VLGLPTPNGLVKIAEHYTGPVVRADPAFVAEVQKRSAPIVDDWIKKASAKGVNAKAALEEFRAEIKKIAAEK